jgi:hypothetical protein
VISNSISLLETVPKTAGKADEQKPPTGKEDFAL